MEATVQYEDEQVPPVRKARPAEGSKQQQRIAARNEEIDQAILNNPSLTVKQLADLCDVSKSTISRSIASLKERSLLGARRNPVRSASSVAKATLSTSIGAGMGGVDGVSAEAGTSAETGTTTQNQEKRRSGLIEKIRSYFLSL